MSEIRPSDMNEARVPRRTVISLLAAWLVKATDMNVHPTGIAKKRPFLAISESLKDS